jgi:hypothetical protein
LRLLVGLGAVAVLSSGCVGAGQPADPTPDPFTGLAERSDQAFQQGVEAFDQGQYRDALNAFQQARMLSPSADPYIDRMIDRTKAAMTPTPTPVPPTPTQAPPTPTATTVAMSRQTSDADLSQRYFGNVVLAAVSSSSKDADAPAATEFFFQDQLGLQIDNLKQYPHLPLELRVFDTDTGRLVAQASVSPTEDLNVVHFRDTYVWYHQGGEQPGRYHVEVYANSALTNTFDYSVGTIPVPTPAPTQTPVPTAAPTVADVPAPPRPTPPPPTPRPAAPPTQPTTAPPLPPTPTPVPTQATAYATQVGGVLTGLDVDSAIGRSYLVDASGVIWSADAPAGTERPTLGIPWFGIQGQAPVDLTVDQSTGYLYISATNPNSIVVLDGRANGAVLRTIPLPAAPGQLRVDSDLGMLYVTVPGLQSIEQIDVHSGTLLRSIDARSASAGPPSPITSLALDPHRHGLYAAHLDGEVTIIDSRSGQALLNSLITTSGLTNLATARGLVYGVNTTTQELDVLEPLSNTVGQYPLSEEPAAVAAAEDTGAVYVLSSSNNVILQVDPTDGTELGRVVVEPDSDDLNLEAAATPQTLAPRIVLQDGSDMLFASFPDRGAIAAVGADQFPDLARSIPYIADPDDPLPSPSAIALPPRVQSNVSGDDDIHGLSIRLSLIAGDVVRAVSLPNAQCQPIDMNKVAEISSEYSSIEQEASALAVRTPGLVHAQALKLAQDAATANANLTYAATHRPDICYVPPST